VGPPPSLPPPPKQEIVVVADPALGIEAGVRTTRSLGHVVFGYEDALPHLADVDEDTAIGRGAAVAARALKLALLDLPITIAEVSVIHEVFGHGARAHEFGVNATYTFRLPEPYMTLFSPGETDRSPGEYHGVNLLPQKDLIVRLGGPEAGYVTAWWIDAEAVAARGWVPHEDMLLYGATKVVYANHVFSTSLERMPNGAPTDDLDAYVTDLQFRFARGRAADRADIVHRLRAAYLWNLADPMLLYSAYATLVDTVWSGRRGSRLPLPSIDGTMVFVTPRFGFSPFGAENYVDVFASRDGVVADVYGRAGTSGLASYTGAGARVLGWKPVRGVTLGGEVDVWRQPGDFLDPTLRRNPTEPVGMNAGVYARLAVLGAVGVTGKLAYKTSGYLMGEPIAEGFYGYVGVSVTP
jgi:hypothetical protein